MDDKELRTQSGDYKTIFYACNCGSYKFTKTLFFVALMSLLVSIFCFFALDSDVQLEERLVWKHENISNPSLLLHLIFTTIDQLTCLLVFSLAATVVGSSVAKRRDRWFLRALMFELLTGLLNCAMCCNFSLLRPNSDPDLKLCECQKVTTSAQLFWETNQ